jgi:hypothetical protein
MRLAVTVDEIAIALGIAIILAIADDCSDYATQDSSNGCAGDGSDAWKNRTRESARAGTECRSCRAARHHMISVRIACTAAERNAAGDSGRD